MNNIELQGGGIQCDNPDCDFVDANVRIDQYEDWLNRPCPKCGSNLLTEEDYAKVQLFMKILGVVDKMDIPKDPDEPQVTMQVDVHNNQMNIIDIESPYGQKKIDEKLKGSKGNKTSDK
jgi:hypothetical protein